MTLFVLVKQNIKIMFIWWFTCFVNECSVTDANLQIGLLGDVNANIRFLNKYVAIDYIVLDFCNLNISDECDISIKRKSQDECKISVCGNSLV